MQCQLRRDAIAVVGPDATMILAEVPRNVSIQKFVTTVRGVNPRRCYRLWMYACNILVVL